MSHHVTSYHIMSHHCHCHITPCNITSKIIVKLQVYFLRLEFQEAWKHGFKAQLLVWNTALLHNFVAVKERDQAKSWALKLCVQASWNNSLRAAVIKVIVKSCHITSCACHVTSHCITSHQMEKERSRMRDRRSEPMQRVVDRSVDRNAKHNFMSPDLSKVMAWLADWILVRDRQIHTHWKKDRQELLLKTPHVVE